MWLIGKKNDKCAVLSISWTVVKSLTIFTKTNLATHSTTFYVQYHILGVQRIFLRKPILFKQLQITIIIRTSMFRYYTLPRVTARPKHNFQNLNKIKTPKYKIRIFQFVFKLLDKFVMQKLQFTHSFIFGQMVCLFLLFLFILKQM